MWINLNKKQYSLAIIFLSSSIMFFWFSVFQTVFVKAEPNKEEILDGDAARFNPGYHGTNHLGARGTDTGFKQNSEMRHMFVIIHEIHDKLVAKTPSVESFNISCNEKSIDGTEDLLCMDPPKFLPEYKNPCWYSRKDRFQCLPYFQLIGMGKCGTSDLFDRIVKHPDVLENRGRRRKETWWWSWLRYVFQSYQDDGQMIMNLKAVCNGTSFTVEKISPQAVIELDHKIRLGMLARMPKQSFQQYLGYFPAAKIEKSPGKRYITGEDFNYNRNPIWNDLCIQGKQTGGDGTPMDLSDNSGWPRIPQNNELTEPKYMTPHLIRHMNPNVKLLVILRDPVERMFSDYFFHGLGNMSTEAFHKQVIYSIKLLHECTRSSSLRACLYDRKFILGLTARLHVGFYVIHLQDWFQVFPREQFLILRTEDYSAAVAENMYKVYQFLDLRDLPATDMEKISGADIKFETQLKKAAGELKPETRAILLELYSVFNHQLAALLDDKRFTWSN